MRTAFPPDPVRPHHPLALQGISGLLPQLKSITKRVHLSDHAGARAAVDAYSLLHKGSYGCARELVEGIPTTRWGWKGVEWAGCDEEEGCYSHWLEQPRGAQCAAALPTQPTLTHRHVDYCMSRVDEFIKAGIQPVIVFDGDRLPSKSQEEGSRQGSRAAALERARALEAAGNATGAYEAYQRAVDIKPIHAFQFILALRKRGIPYVVAPYEADAQMAFLAMTGQVQLVISEDSDMLPYGCPIVRGEWWKGSAAR